MAALRNWIIAVVVIVLVVSGTLVYRSHAAAAHRERVSEAIESAREHLLAGEATKAEDAIRWVVEEAPGETSLALLAQSLEAQGREEKALDVWDELIEAYPESSYAGEAKNAQAAAALRRKDFFAARDLYSEVESTYPGTDAAIQARLGMVEIDYREGNLEAARTTGMAILQDPAINERERSELEKILGEINVSLLYSRQPLEGDLLYEVKPGDYIAKIASNHGISQELLMAVNGIDDPRTLSVGHRLKIPQGDFKIIVDKWSNTLTLFSNDKFFKKYPVRTGKYDYMTPAGSFKIMNKKKDPQWTKPGTGEVVPPNDPENELGTRWMAFSGSQLGIHGTIKPETIGSYASQGCVGLLMDDVEELFDIVPIGTPVEIVGKQNPATLKES